MDLVWRVGGDGFDAEAFVARYRLSPCARHGTSGFNVLLAEDVGPSSLDGLVNAFLTTQAAALQELSRSAVASELDLAFFLQTGEELSSGVCISPLVLAALGQAGVGLAVTTYLCQDD